MPRYRVTYGVWNNDYATEHGEVELEADDEEQATTLGLAMVEAWCEATEIDDDEDDAAPEED